MSLQPAGVMCTALEKVLKKTIGFVNQGNSTRYRKARSYMHTAGFAIGRDRMPQILMKYYSGDMEGQALTGN